MPINLPIICTAITLIQMTYSALKPSICRIPEDKFQALNCSRLNLKVVPSGTMLENMNIRYLDFSYNALTIVNDKTLYKYSRIEHLNLDYNLIKGLTISSLQTFGKYLKHLSLRGNNISLKKHRNSMKFLIHLSVLQELDLSENPLEVLPESFLKPVEKTLRILHLNSLAKSLTIDDGAFLGMEFITHLYWRNNTIVGFRQSAIAGLQPERFQRYSAEDARFNCDCTLAWYHRWYGRVNLQAFQSINDAGFCVTPSIVASQPIRRLQISSYQCEPYLLHTYPPLMHGSTNPSHITVQAQVQKNITISCTFMSRPKLFVRWYKDGALIQTHWPNTYFTISPGEEFVTTLHVQNLRYTDDQSVFRCSCANNRGQAEAIFLLYIVGAPNWPHQYTEFYDYVNRTGQKSDSLYDQLFAGDGSIQWQQVFLLSCLVVMIFVLIALIVFYCCYQICTRWRMGQFKRQRQLNESINPDLKFHSLNGINQDPMCMEHLRMNVGDSGAMDAMVGTGTFQSTEDSPTLSVDSDCPLHSLTGQMNANLMSDCPVHGQLVGVANEENLCPVHQHICGDGT